MAEALYLVTRNMNESGLQNFDGIHAVLVNSDDAGGDAQVIAEATAKCQTLYPSMPSDYFDTVDEIGDLVAGTLGADEATLIILPTGLSAVL